MCACVCEGVRGTRVPTYYLVITYYYVLITYHLLRYAGADCRASLALSWYCRASLALSCCRGVMSIPCSSLMHVLPCSLPCYRRVMSSAFTSLSITHHLSPITCQLASPLLQAGDVVGLPFLVYIFLLSTYHVLPCFFPNPGGRCRYRFYLLIPYL